MLRRRDYLINPRFQLSLIFFFCILALFAIVVFYAENLYIFDRFTSEVGSEELLQDPAIQGMIAEESRRMTLVFGITSFSVLLMMVVGGLVLSNRVAGPLHRLQKHMKQISSRSTDQGVSFRKHDYFQELATSYNELLGSLGLIKTKPNRSAESPNPSSSSLPPN